MKQERPLDGKCKPQKVGLDHSYIKKGTERSLSQGLLDITRCLTCLSHQSRSSEKTNTDLTYYSYRMEGRHHLKPKDYPRCEVFSRWFTIN